MGIGICLHRPVPGGPLPPGRPGSGRGISTRDVVIVARPRALKFYGQTCGWTLARAHARSGDPIATAEYLGASDEFDKSITDFAERYADQNERDYQEFVAAIRAGRLEALEGV